MNKYAILDASGVVVNIVVAHTQIEPEWVEVPDDLAVEKGWTHDGTTFFSGSLDNEDKKISQLAFLNRFTDSEAIAIDLASIGATVEAATIRRFMNKVNAAQYIDLKESDLIAGLNSLESSGLLASGRTIEILNNPIQQHELP